MASKVKKPEFRIDKSILSMFDDYKYPDEIFVVFDFEGNAMASNKDSFEIAFVGTLSYEDFNFYKVIESTYQRLLLRRIAQLSQGENIPPAEYKLVFPNGNTAFVEIFSKPTVYQGQPAIISLVRDISVRKEIEKKQLYAVVQTEEKERQRFAQDLHDELGPFLSGLKLYLHELNARDLSSQHKKQLLDYLGKMTNEAVDKIRSISSNLMPQNMIETGLAGTIESMIENLNKTGKIKIDLKTKGTEAGLDNSFIITLYRIIIELINNTLKHSGADSINIALDFGSNQVHLIYKDNGKGFYFDNTVTQSKGIGLKSIMNRISLFNGSYKFKSKPKEGVEFEICFTLK